MNILLHLVKPACVDAEYVLLNAISSTVGSQFWCMSVVSFRTEGCYDWCRLIISAMALHLKIGVGVTRTVP